jgi:hypothetical protein
MLCAASASRHSHNRSPNDRRSLRCNSTSRFSLSDDTTIG